MKQPLLKDREVLVVEDNNINQLVAKHMLTALSATVDVAWNGRDAIDKLKIKPYDVVLMDVQMPTMDGYEATKYIRETLKSKVPIIAMTAFAFQGDADKCLEAGMNAYISKPFTLEQLTNVLKKTLADPANDPYLLEKEGVVVDISMLYEVAGDDEAYINTMISTFISSLPATFKKIDLALEQNDYQSLYKAAHFAKSSFSVIKVDDLFNTLQTIEQIAKHKSTVEMLPELIKYTKEKFKAAERILSERFVTPAT